MENRKYSVAGAHSTNSLQPLIPHMPVPPKEVCPSLLNSPSAAHFPSRASTIGQIRNSHSFVVVVGLPRGEITSPTISLTWREFLIGLKTCFFN